MDLFDIIFRGIHTLETKSRYEEQNRLSLLFIHSVIGMGVGYAILTDSGPQSLHPLVKGSVLVVLLGLVPFVGGLLLFLGLVIDRNFLLEALGMTMLLIWDLWMFYGFYWALDHGTLTTKYPLFIYAGLASFMCIHLRTLIKCMGQKDGLN